MAQQKLAWGITGAGHKLRESVAAIQKILEAGMRTDLFISQAGETVLKMYNLYALIDQCQKDYPEALKHIFLERDQPPGYPISAKFNLHTYSLLVVSPLSANSVAKMNVGIADTLITNCFSQMIKGSGPIYVFPCDLVPGNIRTEVPGGELVEITIDNFNSQNARNLRKFPTVEIFESVEGITAKILEQWHKNL